MFRFKRVSFPLPTSFFIFFVFGSVLFASITLFETSVSHAAQDVAITYMETGDAMSGEYSLAETKNEFRQDTPMFYMVFKYEGNAADAPFVIKWIYVPSNYLIDQVQLSLPASSGGTGRSSLSIPDKGWPPGEYTVEIWRLEKKLKAAGFSVIPNQ